MCDYFGGCGEVADWAAGLEKLHARIAPRFARAEPGELGVLTYVRGLLVPDADALRQAREEATTHVRSSRTGLLALDVRAIQDGGGDHH